MAFKDDVVNIKARHELTQLRYTLDNMRGAANDRLVDKISKKAGKLFTESIARQIKAKGWSDGAAKQVELRKMKQRYRTTYRGGTYTYVVMYDTPKGSKTAPHMRFQDWGTGTQRTKTLWYDVEGKDYREWEDTEVTYKGIPAQHFQRKAWAAHHRAAERIMLDEYLKVMRKMAHTQSKLRNPKLAIRPAWTR